MQRTIEANTNTKDKIHFIKSYLNVTFLTTKLLFEEVMKSSPANQERKN